jgi:uncharacterized protein (DUF2164 family)
MEGIRFSSGEKAQIVEKIKGYFERELEMEIGGFDAEFLLDFFSDKIGPYYYNRGLQDARAVIEEKLENVADALYEIEQPTEFPR